MIIKNSTQNTHVNQLKSGMLKQIYVLIGAHNKSANRMILIKVTCCHRIYSLSDHHRVIMR